MQCIFKVCNHSAHSLFWLFLKMLSISTGWCTHWRKVSSPKKEGPWAWTTAFDGQVPDLEIWCVCVVYIFIAITSSSLLPEEGVLVRVPSMDYKSIDYKYLYQTRIFMPLFILRVDTWNCNRLVYLIHLCLTLSIIRYVSRVKWSNLGKGVAPSPYTSVQ